MSTIPKLPPLPDLVRAYAPTIEETVQRIVDFLVRRKPDWNYSPCRRVAPAAISHSAPEHAIAHGMLTTGSPGGRTQNFEVVQHIWRAGEGRQLRTSRLPVRTYAFRRDLVIRVPGDFLFIEDHRPNVFWLQPRRSYAFNHLGLGVIASIIRATYLVDNLEGAGLEILDVRLRSTMTASA